MQQHDPVLTDKREAILMAALRLITENGFHATPMSLIAKEAGVAAGTIYHYFDSKEALIVQLYTTLKQRMGQAMLADTGHQANIRTQFFRIWTNLYHHFVRHPTEFRFLEQYANSPFIRKEVREQNSQYYQPAIDFLAEGIAAGVLRPMPVPLMVAIVYGNITAVAKLALNCELAMSEELLQTAAQATWDSVRIN